MGEAGDGPAAVKLARQKRPQVVLMDVHMPGGGGVAAVKALKQEQDVCVLMLTISDNDEDLLGALTAGADGYLLKSAEPEELCRAIRQVAGGRGALSPEVTTKVIQAATTGHERSDTLTVSPREREVLVELAHGATTSDIATSLVISENTVKTHVRRILKKLKAANRTEAVARAADLGILSQD